MARVLQIVERNKASLGIRFLNSILDLMALMVINIILAFIAGFLYEVTGAGVFDFYLNGGKLWDLVIGNIVFFVYYLLMEYYTGGRTIGKYITGTGAIGVDGSRLDFNKALYRSLSRLVPFDGLSFFGTNGWHDSWSDTRVVNLKNYENAKKLEIDLDSIGTKESF